MPRQIERRSSEPDKRKKVWNKKQRAFAAEMTGDDGLMDVFVELLGKRTREREPAKDRGFFEQLLGIED